MNTIKELVDGITAAHMDEGGCVDMDAVLEDFARQLSEAQGKLDAIARSSTAQPSAVVVASDLPEDFRPPYSINSHEGKQKRVFVEIYNDNYVIAKIELGTVKERFALARFIVDACNARALSATAQPSKEKP